VEKRPTREDKLLPAAAGQVRNDDARGLNLKERKEKEAGNIPAIFILPTMNTESCRREKVRRKERKEDEYLLDVHVNT
jgi:hypothetical protein